jgi:hypothetical protein
MLIWDVAGIRIINADVFTDAAEAAQARANLRAGLDSEFRDYPVSLPGFISAASLREHLERQAGIEHELGDDYSERDMNDAYEHWGAARGFREAVKHIDHELETSR